MANDGHGVAGGVVLATRPDLCLDFVNTLAWRGSARSESLHDFAELLQWCVANAGLPERGARVLRSWARNHPSRAEAAFNESLATRETIHRILRAMVAAAEPAEHDMREFNHALARAPSRSAVERDGASRGWRVAFEPGAAAMLAPVLWSAGDLLAGPRPERLRECANRECLWLFVDESKNGARRWCSMSSCGNRAKAHRHYLRRKSRRARFGRPERVK